ncbi:Lmo0850 family protein [Sporosarcina sp. CAU 1771]
MEKVPKEIDLKKIISNLAKLGVSATLTKSRVDMLKALAPPVHDPHIQSQ